MTQNLLIKQNYTFQKYKYNDSSYVIMNIYIDDGHFGVIYRDAHLYMWDEINKNYRYLDKNINNYQTILNSIHDNLDLLVKITAEDILLVKNAEKSIFQKVQSFIRRKDIFSQLILVHGQFYTFKIIGELLDVVPIEVVFSKTGEVLNVNNKGIKFIDRLEDTILIVKLLWEKGIMRPNKRIGKWSIRNQSFYGHFTKLNKNTLLFNVYQDKSHEWAGTTIFNRHGELRSLNKFQSKKDLEKVLNEDKKLVLKGGVL